MVFGRFKIGFILVSIVLMGCFFSCEKNKSTDPDESAFELEFPYFGVNLAGAEFGESNLPGIYGVHYTYPTSGEVDYFLGKGMTIFRLPFRWERLQPMQTGAFNATELRFIRNFVNDATGKGAVVILDPHNYARYYGDVIGSEDMPVLAFADFWRRLAGEFKDNPRVIFSLVNEPHDMPGELWRDDANAAIAAIRETGAANLILVPGIAYSGAHSWTADWYGTSNSETMLTIEDPLNYYAFDVHQYLDSNSSGTHTECVSTTIGSERLVEMTNWLRTHNQRAFLGEFGAANNPVCMAAVDNMLAYIHDNLDVWIGWTWWAAGPWWGESSMSLEPENGVDKPQMAVLEKYL